MSNSGGPVKLRKDVPTVMPVNHAPDSAPTTRRQVKRRHRRRRESSGGGGAVGCVSECVDHSRHSRTHTHIHSDSSSENDEQRWREARSWSREKARRRRSSSRNTPKLAAGREGVELVPVDADEGHKENRSPRIGGAAFKTRKRSSVKRQDPESKLTNNGRGTGYGSERGSEAEHQPITKSYEEHAERDANMTAPDQKYSNTADQNGAAQQACTDDELEVCR